MNKDQSLKMLSAGDFVFSYHHNANVEVLSIVDRGNAYDNNSINRFCINVAGYHAPMDSRHWDLPRKDVETIFHKEVAKNCYDIGFKGLLSDEDFESFVINWKFIS